MNATKVNKFEQFLDSKLIPIGNKVSKQRHLNEVGAQHFVMPVKFPH